MTLRIAVLLVAIFLAQAGGANGGPAAQEPTLPDTERQALERRGELYVQAVNSDSPEDRAAIIQEIFTPASLAKPGPAKIVQSCERIRDGFGTLAFHHAEATPWRGADRVRWTLHVYVRAAGDNGWKDLQFFIDQDPPHKIEQLVFVANVTEPVYLPNGSITDPQVLEWLNGYVDKLVAEEDLSGALLIAHGDQPIIERYFGHADAAGTIPVTPATRFNLGSGNKMFTALAVAMLVEEGRLRFDDPLAKHLPDFPDSALARRVTLHHLLSHTSGVGEYWTDEYEGHRDQIETLEQMLPFVLAAGIDFAPGEQCAYSNSNFILAGLVLERATAEDYFDLIRRRIYAPLGMSDTDSYRMDGSVSGLATPLTGKPRAWSAAGHGLRGSSAGGGFATPRDILRFARGLVSGKIVSAAMLEAMTTSRTASLPDATLNYGYGFILERSAEGLSFGHGGMARGINFEFRHFPAQNLTLIVFCNQDNGAFDDLRKNATRLITMER